MIYLKLAKLLDKPFEKANKEDMERVLQLIEDLDYSPQTKIERRSNITVLSPPPRHKIARLPPQGEKMPLAF